MKGNEGILFSTVINTIDVTVLLELVFYCSSIDFNPTVVFVWEALYSYEELYAHTKQHKLSYSPKNTGLLQPFYGK